MGFVTRLFVRPYRSNVLKPPQGCCTFDAKGRILCSTLPNSFPRDVVQLIGNDVLATFKAAANSGLEMQELTVFYASLTIRANLRSNGAAVFLIPRHDSRAGAPDLVPDNAAP